MLLNTKKIIFMGTPHFASEILKNLLDNKIGIDCVFTQPDRPVGRKKELIPTPVKALALKNSIEVIQYEKLNGDVVDLLKKKSPDLIIVAAYGVILPKKILEIPLFGCINIHASLLPNLRGSSPIHNAIKLGKEETGVSIMLMDEGIDTGAVFLEERVKIERQDLYSDLENKLIKASNKVLLPTLEKIIKREIKAVSQNKENASATKMIKKADGKINWQLQNAKDIFNLYRAFHVWPKTYTFLKIKKLDKKITLTFKDYSNKNYKENIGQIFEENGQFLIQTIKGTLEIDTIQLEGKKEVSVKNFINGNSDFIGRILK